MMIELKQLRALTEELVDKDEQLNARIREWGYALDAIDDVVFIINTEFKITFANKAFVKRINIKKEDLIGKTCCSVLCADRKECTTSNKVEYYIDVLNGWFEYKRSPVIDKNNELMGYISILKDITEKKKAEESLKLDEDSEKKLRQIIDLVPHFIFAKDVDGKYLLANKAIAQAYGTTVENLIGKSDADFIINMGEVANFLEDDRAVIESGIGRYGIEESLTDSKGVTRIFSTAKIPFTESGTNIPSVLGVAVDITEHKYAKEVLESSISQQAKRELIIG